MPDIFVPADTTQNTELIQDLASGQVFNAYILDKMQPELKKFNSSDDFLKRYSVTDDTFDQFILYASSTIKEMDSHELLASRPNIKMLLKAFAARFKWGDNSYYEVMNNNDPTLKKAIEAIN